MVITWALPMDNCIEHFDWIPAQLTGVLEDILADSTVKVVHLPVETESADEV